MKRYCIALADLLVTYTHEELLFQEPYAFNSFTFSPLSWANSGSLIDFLWRTPTEIES